jgi:glycosyltransferase involved in cell wall biosynthesis
MSVAVSVVVPVFNPGPYVQPCLSSLLGQTLGRERYEIIVVDDGSTDGTAPCSTVSPLSTTTC